MKKLFVMGWIFIAYTGIAQTPSTGPLVAEINNDMWKPFLEGIAKDKADLFVDIHSKYFYWTMGGNKTRIMNFNEYSDDSKKVMATRAEQKIKSKLEVRFLERNINSEFAAEKCVTKFTLIHPNKEPTISYSTSLVFSRKENGTWRMITQYIFPENSSEEIYNKASALDDI